MKNFLLVFIGGGLGSILRYWIGVLLPSSTNTFPYATFIVNIIGSLCIGVLFSYFSKYSIQSNKELILITGFCGGFTTFSAFSKECFLLIHQQMWITLISYILLSVALSIAFVALGYQITRTV